MEKKQKLGPFGDYMPQPQREPLTFNVGVEKPEPPTEKVVDSIKKLAESLLFHWKTFPIILPDSITEKRANEGLGDEPYIGVVQFKDLFIAPTFDELEAVATDENGKLKKLQEDQLNMIRKMGEFEVASKNFQGQTHRWRLSKLIQKGSDRTRNSLLENLACSLSLLIITARNRFCSDFFSLTKALQGWYSGLYNLLDLSIGLPSTTAGDLCQKLREERMRYLVAELDIKPNLKKELNTYCQYVKAQCHLLLGNKHKTSDLRPPPIPYRYQTPKGQDIDLRLFNRDLMNNSVGILSNILDRQAKGWHVQMRIKLIRHYQGQNLSNEEISEKVTEEIMDHYLTKVFNAISTNAELDILQPGLGALLVNQARSVLAMMKAKQNLQAKLDLNKEKLLKHLKDRYPIKSRINKWIEEQMRSFECDFIRQNLWTAHEEAISLCEEEGLDQTVYFLRRDLNFIKERETVLRKELGRVKIPTREYTFYTRIWFPHNWIVRQSHIVGRSDVIPTVIRETEPLQKIALDANAVFTVQKKTERVTSTRYPFWRWWNFMQRSWSNTWNLIYMFGIIIPWCSPVGLRALFWPTAFVPDLTQSQFDGSLYPLVSSTTHSLLSRLWSLWANVKESRAQFEAAPDRGFLGKSLTRHLNRFWNYVIKGVFGSVSIVLVFPVMCVTASTLSLAAAIMAPVWVPVITLVAHLFFFLIWDVDNPGPERNRICILLEAVLWNIICQGCIQPVSALFVGALLCPLSALSIFLFGILRSGFRNFWDTAMFHIIIKNRGRVPSSDGFVARRISGPGLASSYFYQIQPEQAMAAVEARLEHDELDAWKKQILSVIEQPKEVYKKFVDECFKPFSASICEHGVYLQLCKETSQYISDLNIKVAEREVKLYTGLNPDLQRRIKLPEADLKLTVAYTAKLLEEFYYDHVIVRLGLSEEEFWDILELEFRDWRGFAAKKLKEIFASSFMVPLEETDNYFQLKVNHMNMKRYTEMLSSSNFHDDLDLVVELHTPEGDVNVLPPQLDVVCFDPAQQQPSSTLPSTSLRSQGCFPTSGLHCVEYDKLEVALPVPHPAHIAIAIYNRENDQEPIDMNDMNCVRIVRATKEVPYIDLNELSSIGPSNTEVSTPDNATTESITVTSHLAIQERSFSDDAVSKHCQSSSEESPLAFPESENSLEKEAKTVYYEVEKDTSCVLNLSDDKA
ncbi:uncharacterized protein LOC131927817 [Physella acuta]|uniref:uncharacterized protein LOC131927817 n=1 Tax=Physella acuta TaxID=109671 RepID=UPI0027DD95F7|nr:uncharacterized protein LOC131927817 [Physella acuta]XP_059139648.1 uncharacterized protein LOC131927817 [Physella acuta]XP_059139649.1 uncharacterized protein LOC131927817 [Physella acuta]XP_059139651.1 uncharacterized protein LOC131927817 [Physella acuta]XP_059139652.1 uncharacterized protein LOC131927817 [Physella acuta]